MTVHVGLWVTLEAKPGHQAQLAAFLDGGASLVAEEPLTVTWYAMRVGETTFAIFDAFVDDEGRQAHLSGQVAAALGAVADQLLAEPPQIRPVEIVASFSR